MATIDFWGLKLEPGTRPTGWQPLLRELLFWVVIGLIVFSCVGPAFGQGFRHKALSHATDCTSLTGKKANQFCYELDDNTWYVCEPTSGDCDTAGGWIQITGGTGAFDDSGDPVVLNTPSKDVVVGAAQKNTSKLTIDGDADQVQVTIQGHSTQTTDLFVVEDSAGVDLFTVDNTARVGIGTASPQELLHLLVSSGDVSLKIETDVGSGDEVAIWFRSGETDYKIVQSETSNYLDFQNVAGVNVFRIGENSLSDALVIEQSGRDIGMGTASPLDRLHVKTGDARVRLEGTDP